MTIFAPADAVSCAFFADLLAVLTDHSATSAHLAANLADIVAFFATVIVDADSHAVAADVTVAAPANCL